MQLIPRSFVFRAILILEISMLNAVVIDQWKTVDIGIPGDRAYLNRRKLCGICRECEQSAAGHGSKRRLGKRWNVNVHYYCFPD
ncbi:hypothetical protein D3C80_1382880 [compost metagenome]